MQFLFTNKPVFEALNQFWGTVESKKLVLDPKQPIPTFNEVKYILLGEAENGSVPYNVDNIVENKTNKSMGRYIAWSELVATFPIVLFPALIVFAILSTRDTIWIPFIIAWVILLALFLIQVSRIGNLPSLHEEYFNREFYNRYSKKYVEAVYVWLDANGHTEHREGNNETIDAKLQDSHSLASTIMSYESTPLPFMIGAKQTGFVTSEKPNTLIISFTN